MRAAAEQWETLFSGTVTTEENSAVNGAAFGGSITNYNSIKFYPEETIRLTVDGVATVFTAVDRGGNSAYVGNEWLASVKGVSTVPDTGYDYRFSNMTNSFSMFYFHSRTVGTYTIKIERLVIA